MTQASTPQSATPLWIAANEGGVYFALLDTNNGEISRLSQLPHDVNGYFIAKHPSKPLLYVAGRQGDSSNLHVFSIAADFSLKLEYTSAGHPRGVAHISVSPDGNLLAAAYYPSSYAGVYALSDGGKKISTVAEIKHTGKSVHAKQEAPHPHWGGFFTHSDRAYFTDLGNDSLYVYKVGEQNLQLLQQLSVQPGNGPRHMSFHEALSQLYVSDEFKARVSRYHLDADSGLMRYIDSTQPSELAKKEAWYNASDIKIHPSGRFLYMVNRGFDQVSVFQIDNTTGALAFVENEPVRGSIARHINFTEDGKWALVLGKQSNTLAVFKVNPETGELTFTRPTHKVPSPMALVFN